MSRIKLEMGCNVHPGVGVIDCEKCEEIRDFHGSFQDLVTQARDKGWFVEYTYSADTVPNAA